MHHRRIEEFIDFLINMVDEKPELWEKLDKTINEYDYELKSPNMKNTRVSLKRNSTDTVFLRIQTEKDTYRFNSSYWVSLREKLHKLYDSVHMCILFRDKTDNGEDLLNNLDEIILSL